MYSTDTETYIQFMPAPLFICSDICCLQDLELGGMPSQLVIIPLTAPGSWQIQFYPLIMWKIIKYS